MDEDINVAAGILSAHFGHITPIDGRSPLCLTGFKQCKLQLRPATIRRAAHPFVSHSCSHYLPRQPADLLFYYRTYRCAIVSLRAYFSLGTDAPFRRVERQLLITMSIGRLRASPIVKHTLTPVVGSLCEMNYSHNVACIFAWCTR